MGGDEQLWSVMEERRRQVLAAARERLAARNAPSGGLLTRTARGVRGRRAAHGGPSLQPAAGAPRR